jgi:SAM-dependent methyltransferase
VTPGADRSATPSSVSSAHDGVAADAARRLFTERPDSYVRFINTVGYPAGLRAYFRASPLLCCPGLRVLEAGCGSGALTLAVHAAAERRGVPLAALDAFDLTPAMLARLRATLDDHGIGRVELREANVLALDALPASWRDYDLVVSASMLEYVPRERFAATLAGLRQRLRVGGTLVIFVTRRYLLMRLLIGRWWRSNLYTAAELAAAFREAGFTTVRFPRFPLAARHLAFWGHVVEAE